MSSRKPLAITQRQAQSLCRAAKAEGIVIEVKTEIGVVRLIPANLVTPDPRVDPEPEGTM